MRKISRVLAMVLVLGLAVAAVALAATPKKGTFSSTNITLTVKSGNITKVTGTLGSKCNSKPISLKKTITVTGGAFNFKGKVKTTAKKSAGTLTLSGTFTTTKKAVGTYKLTHTTKKGKKKTTCSTGTKSFTATHA